VRNFDDRARLAGARLRDSVGAVSPRPLTTMTSNRTRALGVTVAVLVVAAVIGAAVTASHHASGNSNLTPTASPPAGITTRTFAPAGLGATVTVPSHWADSRPSSGFQYAAGSVAPPSGFVGAGNQSSVVPVSLSALKDQRRQFLESIGAKIDSAKTGTVDGRPAVRFHYKLTVGNQSVIDNEYDIVATSTLPVGAAQHQSVYNVITIVVGTPVSSPNQPLLDWVGSTIKIQ